MTNLVTICRIFTTYSSWLTKFTTIYDELQHHQEPREVVANTANDHDTPMLGPWNHFLNNLVYDQSVLTNFEHHTTLSCGIDA